MSYEVRMTQYLRCDHPDGCKRLVEIETTRTGNPIWPDGWKKHEEYANDHRCPDHDFPEGNTDANT